MLVSDFDYALPEELIAQEPCALRDRSRLLVVHRASSCLEHRWFYDLVEYVHAGDVLVLNETRVIPARLTGYRRDTGMSVEVFLLRPLDHPLVWEVLVRPGKKARVGAELHFGSEDNGIGLKLEGRVCQVNGEGNRIIQFRAPGTTDQVLAAKLTGIFDELGKIPLPPYIQRAPRPEDYQRYQTVYAREAGSVAAPTAGLHFTTELLTQLQQKGVVLAPLVLHVGLGTFRPVKVTEVEQHRMHTEYFKVPDSTAAMLNQARSAGSRIFAVGTTTARVLESVTDEKGKIRAGEGWTDIFLYPGYAFKAVDSLVTNFHLPRSTLLMLVCALGGRELILRAYQEAVAKQYRFFSYGDAMLVV